MCVCIDQSQVHLEDTADKAADSLTLRHTLYLNIITARRHIHTSCYIPLWPEAFFHERFFFFFSLFFLSSFRFVVVTSAWQKGCYFAAGALNRLIRKTQRELNLWLLSSFSSMKEERVSVSSAAGTGGTYLAEPGAETKHGKDLDAGTTGLMTVRHSLTVQAFKCCAKNHNSELVNGLTWVLKV